MPYFNPYIDAAAPSAQYMQQGYFPQQAEYQYQTERIDPDELQKLDAFPQWMQTGQDAYSASLLAAQQGLPQLFSGGGIDRAYNRLNTNIGAIGQQNAQAAARSYSSRAAQAGATGQAAGIVQGQAMLPFIRQQAENTTRAEGLKAEQRGRQAQVSAQLAGEIAANRAKQQGLMSSYAETMQRLAQSQEGLGLQRAELGANNYFRGADLALRQRQFDASQAAARQQGEGGVPTIQDALWKRKMLADIGGAQSQGNWQQEYAEAARMGILQHADPTLWEAGGGGGGRGGGGIGTRVGVSHTPAKAPLNDNTAVGAWNLFAARNPYGTRQDFERKNDKGESVASMYARMYQSGYQPTGYR